MARLHWLLLHLLYDQLLVLHFLLRGEAVVDYAVLLALPARLLLDFLAQLHFYYYYRESSSRKLKGIWVTHKKMNIFSLVRSVLLSI